MRHLGLSGRAQAGKDTVGDFLRRTYGYRQYALADPLRKMALDIDPPIAWNAVLNEPVRLADAVRKLGWEAVKRDYPEARRFLQRLGSEGIRDHVSPHYWTDLGRKFIQTSLQPVVITDVRFPEERDMVRRMGGLWVWIERPGDNPASGHKSEGALDPELADFIVENDGSLDDLRTAVDHLMLGVSYSA